MQNWAPVVAAAISAPIAAIAALAGVALQARLGRRDRTAAERRLDKRQRELERRDAVSSLLAAIDAASEAEQIALLAPTRPSEVTAKGKRLEEIDPDKAPETIQMLRKSAVDLLVCANRLRLVDPEFFDDRSFGEIRQLAAGNRAWPIGWIDVPFGRAVYNSVLERFRASTVAGGTR